MDKHAPDKPLLERQRAARLFCRYELEARYSAEPMDEECATPAEPAVADDSGEGVGKDLAGMFH